MNLKTLLKPFIPHIVWSGISRALSFREMQEAGKAYFASSRGEPAPRMLSEQEFSISFKRVSSSLGTFFVPAYAEHRPASRAILNGTLYEPATHAVVSELLRGRGASLVHAGTFFGDMLPSFSQSCSGTVYAFEPVLENYVLAKLCLQENALDNVILINAGLGEELAVARVETRDDQEGHRGGGSQISDKGQLTALMTIDALEIGDLAIIQLDVEGHELAALHGASATIGKCRPIVMIEDNRNNCGEFLEALQYSLCGKIPGLSIWAADSDKHTVDNILRRL